MSPYSKLKIDLNSKGSAYVERYGLLMQASSECTCDYNIATNDLYLSESFKSVFGIKPISIDQNRALYISHIHPDDFPRVNAEFNDALYNSKEVNFNIEYRLIKGDGDYAFIQDKVIVLRNEQGKPYRVLNVIKDVSSEHFYQQIEEIEREIMELSMSEDANLYNIVTDYLLSLQQLFPNMKASVLKIVNNKIENLSSPSLPIEYINRINGLEIANNRGSCGTSAYTKKMVVVEDVLTDERWAEFKDLCIEHHIAACWSQPIFNTKNEVVATFANYYSEKRIPNRWEAYAIDRSQKLLSIVFSKFEYIDRIKSSNDKFTFVSQLTNDAIYEWDIENRELIWGDGFERIFGHQLQPEVKYPSSHWNSLIHPSEFEQVQNRLDEFVADKNAWQWSADYRFLKSDGTYAYVRELGKVVRDEQGKALKMYGLLRDISESVLSNNRKQLENEISEAFKERVSLADSLTRLLSILSANTGFDTAEVWLFAKDKQHINLVSTYASHPTAKIFFDQSKNINRFAVNEGLSGLVLRDKTSMVWNDVLHKNEFLRKEAAKQAKLISASGIPLKYKLQEVGALVFCHSKEIDANDYHLKIIEDLSDFIGAEILRKQQEEEMLLLFESSPDILAVVSANGHYSKVNPAFCNLLGYTAEEIVNTPFIEFLHPDDLKATEVVYKESISGENSANNFINRYRTKAGHYVWIAWSSSNLFGDEGYAFAYGRNISDFIELQRLLDSATKLSKVGGWELDLSTKNNGALYWSKITREILEVPDDYQPTLAEGLDFYTGEDAVKIRSAVKDLIDEGKEFDLEIQVTLKSGQKKWVRSIGQSERMNGQCVKIYGSYQDIDKQKKVEIELLEAFEENNRILESIGHGFMALDLEWKVTYWNKHAEAYLFLSKEQAMGNSLWEMFPDSLDSISYREYSRAMRDQVSVHFEDYHPLTDKWFEANAYPSEKGISIFFRDISDRKKAELQIIESEKRYSDIFHLSPQPMWIIDIEHATFLDVNKAALEQYGYSHDDFLKMNVGDLRPVEDRQKVFELLKSTREHTTFENIGIWTHLKKDGTRIKVEIRSKSITFKNVQAKIILATDITERLNHLEALESQNKKLKEIAWLQSHIVRAPLARLMGLVDLISENRMSEIEKERIFEYFKESAKELDIVINDIVLKSHEVQKSSEN